MSCPAQLSQSSVRFLSFHIIACSPDRPDERAPIWPNIISLHSSFSSSNLQRLKREVNQSSGEKGRESGARSEPVVRRRRDLRVCVQIERERGESANEQFMNEDEEGCLLFLLPSSLILWPASSFADAPDSNGILCGPDRWLILSFNQNRPTRTS